MLAELQIEGKTNINLIYLNVNPFWILFARTIQILFSNHDIYFIGSLQRPTLNTLTAHRLGTTDAEKKTPWRHRNQRMDP